MKYDESLIRRQDRLLSLEMACNLLQSGEFGFLAMAAECESGMCAGYGVPISFVWDGNDVIYLHCAKEGRKLECLDKMPNVTFCVVGATKVIPNQFTTAYESVLAACVAQRNLSDAEKMHALELILDKYSPNCKEVGMKYAEKSFFRTEIIRLNILSLSGKAKVVK